MSPYQVMVSKVLVFFLDWVKIDVRSVFDSNNMMKII